jgi:hypothetical protein
VVVVVAVVVEEGVCGMGGRRRKRRRPSFMGDSRIVRLQVDKVVTKSEQYVHVEYAAGSISQSIPSAHWECTLWYQVRSVDHGEVSEIQFLVFMRGNVQMNFLF